MLHKLRRSYWIVSPNVYLPFNVHYRRRLKPTMRYPTVAVLICLAVEIAIAIGLLRLVGVLR